MTTDHRRRPTYRTGDRVTLTVTASVDGYRYCVAGRRDGNVLPDVPAGAVDGAQLRGSTVVTIPSRRPPSGLTARPKLREIRCWFGDLDLTSELPPVLTAAPSQGASELSADDVDRMSAQLGSTSMSAGVLTIDAK